MSASTELLTTPLAAMHAQMQAKMTAFAGYSLPLYFEGFKQEHLHTRSQASLFDISHMGIIELSGSNLVPTLESLLPANVNDLQQHRSLITVLPNEQGGIIDDLMLTRTEDGFRLVANGSRKHVVIDTFKQALEPDQELRYRDDMAFVALQGPAAVQVLQQHNPDVAAMRFLDAGEFKLGDVTVFITRSGYTGEDGFEIAVAATDAEQLSRTLLQDQRVKAAGLGARDSLRLEAGLCLYGHELNETISPVEAALGWMIPKQRREDATPFPGKAIILQQLASGPARKRTGLIVQDKVPVREGTIIVDAGNNEVGIVTSGVFSPTLEQPIAQAYIDSAHAQPGTELLAMVRKKLLPVSVTALPFIKLNYQR